MSQTTSSDQHELDPNAFEIHHARVRDDVELAYIREGIGGVPLVLIHGWPSTKRIFWRNVKPLAEAGFEVIVPDQRGFGDSPKPSTVVDIAASARDIHALMTGLGHERVIAGGGDFGSGVVQDMSNRFPGFVERQIIWNGIPPSVPEAYEAAGVGGNLLQEVADLSSHMEEHAVDPDGFVQKFPTAEDRIAYIRSYHQEGGARVWRPGHDPIQYTSPGAFGEAASIFMSEPFGDADSFRASLGFYEGALGFLKENPPEETVEEPLLAQPNTIETMILYGQLDQIVGSKYARRAEAGSERPVGPFLIEGSGHFVQFERARVFNTALIVFCRDLLANGLG
jgi:pimeloyl-ACP methyl ester carboxylesterase